MNFRKSLEAIFENALQLFKIRNITVYSYSLWLSRLILKPEIKVRGVKGEDILKEVLKQVPVPAL